MKTCEEWSIAFDLYYNNIASDKAPGVNEFEKSRYLTDAQKSIVIALAKGSLGPAFESTEEVTDYLHSIVKQAEKTPVNNPPYNIPIPEGSYVFELPDKLLFRTWEGCEITVASCGKKIVPVIPVTQDEYWRTVRNPFKKQNEDRVLRLSYSKFEPATGKEYGHTQYSELISDSPVSKYYVRYIEEPEPIVLDDFSSSDLSIDGVNTSQTCQLPEALHQLILAEAVRLAKASWNA